MQNASLQLSRCVSNESNQEGRNQIFSCPFPFSRTVARFFKKQNCLSLSLQRENIYIIKYICPVSHLIHRTIRAAYSSCPAKHVLDLPNWRGSWWSSFEAGSKMTSFKVGWEAGWQMVLFSFVSLYLSKQKDKVKPEFAQLKKAKQA